LPNSSGISRPQLGRAIYEERIREEVEIEHEGKSLVVDVTIGGYVVNDEDRRPLAWTPGSATLRMS
jgi:hypothetical protein